jgi:hypothetical protein
LKGQICYSIHSLHDYAQARGWETEEYADTSGIRLMMDVLLELYLGKLVLVFSS